MGLVKHKMLWSSTLITRNSLNETQGTPLVAIACKWLEQCQVFTEHFKPFDKLDKQVNEKGSKDSSWATEKSYVVKALVSCEGGRWCTALPVIAKPCAPGALNCTALYFYADAIALLCRMLCVLCITLMQWWEPFLGIFTPKCASLQCTHMVGQMGLEIFAKWVHCF